MPLGGCVRCTLHTHDILIQSVRHMLMDGQTWSYKYFCYIARENLTVITRYIVTFLASYLSFHISLSSRIPFFLRESCSFQLKCCLLNIFFLLVHKQQNEIFLVIVHFCSPCQRPKASFPYKIYIQYRNTWHVFIKIITDRQISREGGLMHSCDTVSINTYF